MAKTRSDDPVPGSKQQSDTGRVSGRVSDMFDPFKERTIPAIDAAPYNRVAFTHSDPPGAQLVGSIEDVPADSVALTNMPVNVRIDSATGSLFSHDAARNAVGEAAANVARSAHAVAVASQQAVRIAFTLTPDGEFLHGEIVPISPSQDDADSSADGSDRLSGALARARQRGERRAAEILDGPEMLNSDTMAKRLGVSRETVNRMRQRGELLGLEGARRGVRYPEWQLLPPGQLPMREMSELYRILGEPWAVYRFLLQVHPELGGQRALDAIRDGRGTATIELSGTIAAGAVS